MKASDINSTLIHQMVDDDGFGDGVKLEAIKNLKKRFDECRLANLRLESILSRSAIGQNRHFGLLDGDLLRNYGFSLIDHVGRDPPLDPNLLQQIEFVLLELKKRNDPGSDLLAEQAWIRIRHLPVGHLGFVTRLAASSKAAFERIAFDLAVNRSHVDYHVGTASESPEFFQAITSVLNGILIKSEGNESVSRLISFFVGQVMSACRKKRKNFLSLYPSDCSRLVSLLTISPDAYSEESVDGRVVLRLILNMFKSNRKRTLLLLSHFSDWLLPFKSYLDENAREIM